MKKIFITLMFLPFIGLTQSSSILDPNQAALKWLEKIDNKKYESSWKDADILIQNAVIIEKWETTISPSREPFGQVISRNINDQKSYTELPGAPDGEYIIITFDTSFEQKKSSKETITMKKGEDGAWRVAGYFIQ